MAVPQSQKAKEGFHAALSSNPVAPKSDICFINELPSKLLSHIFEIGSADKESEIEDNGDVSDDYWDEFYDLHFDSWMDTENDTYDDHVEMKEELELEDEGEDDEDEGDENEDKQGSEEATDDKGNSGPTRSSDSHSPTPRVPFQLLVSLVCRHWCDVAFATPSLWTTIKVGPMARGSYNLESTALDRSKNLPMDVSIDCEDYDFRSPSDAHIKDVFSKLIPHIHRWRKMEVTATVYHHMYLFLSMVSDPSVPAAPQLKTLKLYHNDTAEEFESFGYPDMSKHLTLFGGSAPSLTRLVLSGVHVDWNQPWISSASNLIELELSFHAEDVRPSWAQFTSILRGSPALEKLALRQSGPSGDPAEWFIEPTAGGSGDLNNPIPLPRVTEFHPILQSQARAIGLFRKMYLPALKNITLSFNLRSGDYTELVRELVGPATSLNSSQEQSRSLLNGLESLQIINLPCLTECVEMLYGELQNLRSLTLSMLGLSMRFLDILATPCTLVGRGDVWLPRLETLYVYSASGDVLCRVVRNRRDAGVPLSSLYVQKYSTLYKPDAEWLKKNVKTFKFFDLF